MNEGITFGQAWAYGGFLMWVLSLFSILALTAVIYILVVYRKKVFIPEAVERIKKSADPEAEGSRIAEKMYANIDWLADIAAIAPLVGLLGTVLGMFQAFSGIESVGNKSGVLAQGVSQAIVTTIFGLIVAIPSLIAHAILRRYAAKLITELELCIETELSDQGKEKKDAVL